MDSIGATVSNLIRENFPEQYRENGPLFVAFVTEYYKWLESKSLAKDEWFPVQTSLVSVQNISANVTGYGTFFTTQFDKGDYIAISRNDDADSYEIYQIKSITNDTLLTLTTKPTLSITKTKYATVSNKPNALFLTRNFFDIHDIDETFDEYVVYFKEKYLKGLQFKTITNTKTLVKHSLDLYRSKGTERSIDLLYKIVFGKAAKLYYPGQDIFRLSSGIWFIPRYLELTMSPTNRSLIHKEVVGVTSGATAFIEEITRRISANKIIEIAYISTINGSFVTGEKITLRDQSLNIIDAPTVIGSLNEIEINSQGSGADFVKNELVNIKSLHGTQAKGKVLSTATTTGQLQFDFVDGGYGFTNTTVTTISDNVLTFSNAVFTTSYVGPDYVPYMTAITQPLARLTYTGATGNFVVGADVYTYTAGGAQAGHGTILLASKKTSTTGTLTVAVLSGSMNNTFYTTANAIMANLTAGGFTDLTVTANVMGNYSNATIVANAINGTFVAGESIAQPATGAEGTINNLGLSANGSEITLTIKDAHGIFVNGGVVTGSDSLASATVKNAEVYLGVVNATADFYVIPGNYAYTNAMTGTITAVSLGTGAEVVFSNNITYTETISRATDFINSYLSSTLGGTWDFPANHTATLASKIGDTMSYINYTIGKIDSMRSFTPGFAYTKSPIVRVVDPVIMKLDVPGTVRVNVDNAAGFKVGEIITQSSTSARGRIMSIDGGTLTVLNMKFNALNMFDPAGTNVIGADSGASADILTVDVVLESARMGSDITITSSLSAVAGSVTSVKVLDSGYGFEDGEVVDITTDGKAAQGYAVLKTNGTGSGYYKSTDGFLSNNKKLSDGYYYQEYSYEVRSSVIDDFKTILKDIVHVAGTAYYDALKYDSLNQSHLSINTINTPYISGGELLLHDGTSFLLLRNGTDYLTLGH